MKCRGEVTSGGIDPFEPKLFRYASVTAQDVSVKPDPLPGLYPSVLLFFLFIL